jgi:hypothetical protein
MTTAQNRMIFMDTVAQQAVPSLVPILRFDMTVKRARYHEGEALEKEAGSDAASHTSSQDDERRRKVRFTSPPSVLPEEIHLQILSHLQEVSFDRKASESRKQEFRANRQTLCSAMRVSRVFERIVTPLLYAVVEAATVDDYSQGSPTCHLLVRTLLARPERAALVQTIVAGSIDPHFTLSSRNLSLSSDWDPESCRALLTSMRWYLEADEGCSGMTSSERLLSDDVALVIILKLCNRLTTLDLDLAKHSASYTNSFLTSQANTFLKIQLERRHTTSGRSPSESSVQPILPLLHTLTLHVGSNCFNSGNTYLSQWAHFLLFPRLTTLKCHRLTFGSFDNDLDWQAWLRLYRPADIRQFYTFGQLEGFLPGFLGIMPQLQVFHFVNDGWSDWLDCENAVEPILEEVSRLGLPLRELRFDAAADRDYHIRKGSPWCGLANISTLEVVGLPYRAIESSYSNELFEDFTVDEGPLTWFLPPNLRTLEIRDFECEEPDMHPALRALMTDARYPKLSQIQLLLNRDPESRYEPSIHDLEAMLTPGWRIDFFLKSPHDPLSFDLIVLHRRL